MASTATFIYAARRTPHEALRKWVRKTEADEGRRKDLLTSQEREELKALRGEVRELRRANEILTASAYCRFQRRRSGRLAGRGSPRRRKC